MGTGKREQRTKNENARKKKMKEKVKTRNRESSELRKSDRYITSSSVQFSMHNITITLHSSREIIIEIFSSNFISRKQGFVEIVIV